MTGKIADAVSSQLANSWLSQVGTPAFAFWFGGLFVWAWSRDGTSWDKAIKAWLSSDNQPVTLGILFASTVLIALTGSLVERTTFLTLRRLEGYWPRHLSRLGARRWLKRRRCLQDEWNTLAAVVDERRATADQRSRYVELDQLLRRFPDDEGEVMPTALGNVLKAAETRPRDRYGLDPVGCWIHLWMVLPETARSELEAARTRLDSAVIAWTWAALFVVWTPLAWWVPLVALPMATALYAAMVLPAARNFADLVEAAFDIHRHELYAALRLEIPTTSAAERALGTSINEYLLRGPSDDVEVREV
jgi:hypothetical protein